MAKEWYMLAPPPTYTSGFENDDFSYYSKSGFTDTLNSFVSSDLILYRDKPIINKENSNGIAIKGIIQNVTADSQASAFKRQILCGIGTIKTGDYIYYDNNYWLIVGLVGNNKVYEKAVMYYCNYNLNFISPLTNKVVTYPIYESNSTQYNSGITYKQQMVIGSAQHMIYISCNEETILIDHDKRFLIDKNTTNPTAYILTQSDTTTNNYNDKGVLCWTVTESQFNPNVDNKDLMVADYYTENVNETQQDSIENFESNVNNDNNNKWI